ncbi:MULTISPECIES: LysR family transcriptional regulator [Rhizobium]|uniref:HTH-type transcriptional regulator TtuA n=1 Tax=Rhizobium favelukesii TaxID=348824 RepID=W6RQ44_9HYPH|nr:MULTISPECIES: LysR family transcriptional regulator [Rhizobium]MCS0458662.1 LysR family transcriptional regulator [Rhizobium favelukesii]UFS79556.1 LysR family transcriptional regulator [Rhizobium sp. T136]CDM63172.1 transcriptional regulator [Rhizobium favelukesii]
MKVFSENTNIGLRHLRAALTVTEEGSFSRAAQRLGVVPSALTETIRTLELECGTAIFDRKTRPVRTTEAGEAFLEGARDLLDRFELSLTNLRQVGGLKRGRVAIGAAPSAVLSPLSDAIMTFRADHPGIDIIVHDDVAERLAGMVVNRTLDFALAGPGFESAELDGRKISEDPFGLVCHRDHHLARSKRPIVLADINPEDVIALDGQAGIARMLADCPELPPRLTMGRIQTFSTIAQLTLISRNAGVALLPQQAAKVIQSDDIVFRAIADFRLIRSLFLLTRNRSSLPPAAERFVSYLF